MKQHLKQYLKQYYWLLLLTLLIALSLALGTEGQAVAQNRWSPQQRIPNYGNESFPPYMVADLNKTVHVFNYQQIPNAGKTQAIFYRQWSLERGWSKPVDILLSPIHDAPQLQGVVLDKTGMFHLIFFAGNELEGSIYYSKAPAVDAGRAPAWMKPRLILRNAGPFPYAALATDDTGKLFIVYAGEQAGIGLYETHSLDNGENWSNPTTIALTYSDVLWPQAINMTIDPEGVLHMLWSTWNQTGTSDAVNYANLPPPYQQWSQPQVLATRDPDDYEADWGSIISYHGELIVLYQDGKPATKWMVRSNDGGKSWSPPVHPWDLVGEYRAARMLVDSKDQLHVLLGDRNGDCCHGTWHGLWQNGSWSALEPLVMAPKSPTYDPSAQQAVLSQGNVLLATWWTDTGGGPRNGAWFSYGILDAPELPVVALATSVPIPTNVPPTPRAVATEITTPEIAQPNSVPVPPSDRAATTANPLWAIVFGITPAVMVILAAIALQRMKKRSRN